MKPVVQKIWMVIVFLCMTIYASAYDFEVDGIAYTITSFSDLTCSVTASDVAYDGEIVVPSEVMYKGKSLTVTSISDSAFKNSHIKSVQIPETVIEIEANAFENCEDLCSIELNEGLQSIGNYAFNGCNNLLKIVFPSSLKTIGSAGFANCESLSQIDLTTGITNVGASAFMNCKGVCKASLANITVLESNVFNGCISLHKVEWSNNLQQIQDYAFANCGFTKFIIPNSVTTIGTNILMGNVNLQSFTIGNGISEILSDPIAQCPNVSEFVIADGANTLTLDFSSGEYYNVATDAATSSDEHWKRQYYYIRPGAYSSSTFDEVYIGRPLDTHCYTEKTGAWGSGLNYDYWYHYFTLPPFNDNKNIKFVTIGSNVTRIYGFHFSSKNKSFDYGWLEGCSNLEMLTISGLSKIPELFAKDAISLKTVELPNTTLSVGEKAFSNCVSLETIMFGSKLSTIESNALENCNALASIYCKSKTPPTYSTGFNNDIYLNCHLNIPFEAEHYYKSASPWNNFWNISESQECVSDFIVGDLIYSVTAGNNVIVSGNIVADKRDIVIPSYVEYYATDYNVVGIGESSFKYAPINSIVIPGCVSNIYNDAFNGCRELKSITIEYSGDAVILGHKSDLQLSNSIIPYPNATTVDEKRTGFRNGYYDGLFYGLPIEHLVVNRDIELPQYYERITGSSTYNYSTIYNDIIYYPPFYGLTNLKSVEIGGNVSAICQNHIEAVVNAIPTTMEYTNFGKCDSIEVVVSNNPTAPIGGGFSPTVYENASLFLPNSGEDSYLNNEYWRRFSNRYDAPFVAVESISFDSDELLLDLNESKLLQPTINPTDASISKLRWTSSAPSIVSVSEDGIVSSSTREGEAIITASARDGSGVTSSIKVSVQKGAGVNDITVDGRVTIQVENGKIFIQDKRDSDIVQVYNIQGERLISTTTNIIRLNTKGIFIVKVGSLCKKVTL